MENQEMKSKLEEWLTQSLGGKAGIGQMYSLSGGACQDNYLVDLDVDGGSNKGKYELVLRMDKGGSLFGSLSRADEFAVADVASQAGVKTPRPFWLGTDTSVIGHPFYFMQRIKGSANGRNLVRDKGLEKVRKILPDELGRSLAKLHSITPKNCPRPELIKKLEQFSGSGGPAEGAIAEMRKEVAALDEPHPASELALNWLEKNMPTTDQRVLVHGDFRTGNFMVTDTELTGIVDWEFAHWGDRHEDISWLCMRDWRFGKNNKEAGGFMDREEFYTAYEKHANVKVDPRKVLFWEIMGNLRWAMGTVQQAERHLSGKDKGIELASIGRRTCEMEYEIMRLIENAG